MMNKRRTRKIGRTKYLMFIPLAALLMIVSNIETVARTTKEFAKEIMRKQELSTVPQAEEWIEEATNTIPPEDQNDTLIFNVPRIETESVADNDTTIYQVAEQMPEFPGGLKELMQYLRVNVRYPAEAHAKGIEGRVIVTFVVRKDGTVTDTKTVRGVDPYLDKEAERVVNAMPKWIPGKQGGRPVNVRFTVPISFRLEKPEPAETPQTVAVRNSDLSEMVVVGHGAANKEDVANNEPVFKVVEEMPKFPMGQEGLMRYLAQNIKYPAIAQKNQEEGRVIIQMIVGKDGNISNIKVLRSVSPTLDAEAIRVVSNMPQWEPGKQNGQAVAVEFTIPISFQLQSLHHVQEK